MANANAAPLWSLLPAGVFLLALPLNHNMALRLLCLFLAAAVALRHFLKVGIPSFPLKWPLALWAGLAVLSLSWSLDPWFTLNEIKSEIVYGMLALFSFYAITESEREWLLWLRCLTAGMAVTVLLLLWDNRAAPTNFLGYNWDVVHGFVAYSTYLALIAPFLLALWVAVPLRNFPRNTVWLFAPLFLFAGYATLNRMFWLSLGATVVLFATLWRKEHQTRWRVRLLVVPFALLLVAFLFVGVAKQRPVDPLAAPTENTATISHVIDTFRNSERLTIWRFWLERIAEKPFTGVGFGRDLPHFVYAELKPKEWFTLMFAHAHNLFLDYLLQLGIGGLIVLLLLLGGLLRAFWRIRGASAPQANIVGLCGIALVVTLVSKNFTDDLFWRSDSLLFWALTGMALGYGKRLENAA